MAGLCDVGRVLLVLLIVAVGQAQLQFPPNLHWQEQWYMMNKPAMENGVCDVEAAWNGGKINGSGVTLAIIGQAGFNHLHRNLEQRYDADASKTFTDDVGTRDIRTTALAGVMVGDAIGAGCIGVSFGGKIANIINNFSTDQLTSDAILWGSKNSADEKDLDVVLISASARNGGVHYLEGPGPLTRAALSQAVTLTGRQRKGTTFIVGVGDEGMKYRDQNNNFDGWASSPYTIAIAGIEKNNTPMHPGYHAPGTAVTAVAPTGADELHTVVLNGATVNGVLTAYKERDIPAAIVSGIVGLMYQVNPKLSSLDIHEAIIRTAYQINPDDEGWVTNGAGLKYHDFYGFGVVDAPRCLEMAGSMDPTHYQFPVSHTYQFTTPIQIPNDAITKGIDNYYDIKGRPVTANFTVTDSFNVSRVEVKVDIEHTFPGDLEIDLVSPSGIKARLARPHHINRTTTLVWGHQNIPHDAEAPLYGPKWKKGVISVTNFTSSSYTGCGSTVKEAFPDVEDGPFAEEENRLLILNDTKNCHFYERVLNAQTLGFRGVIFINPDGEEPFIIKEKKLEDLEIAALVIGKSSGSSLTSNLKASGHNLPTFIVLTHHFKDTCDTYSNWTFSSMVHWGENAQGTWQLLVSDNDHYNDTNNNFLQQASITLHKPGSKGGAQPPPPPPVPAPLVPPPVPVPVTAPVPVPPPVPAPVHVPPPHHVPPPVVPPANYPAPLPVSVPVVVPVPVPVFHPSGVEPPPPGDDVEKPPSHHHGLSSGGLAGVIIGSVTGGLLLVALIVFAVIKLKNRSAGNPNPNRFKKFGGVVINEDSPAQMEGEEEFDVEEAEQPPPEDNYY